jgi:hypothetical protein
VVACEVSKQPPWSMATSTSTEPGFIVFSMSRVTSFGAAAPGTSTAPITRSARRTSSSIAERVENTVEIAVPNWLASRAAHPPNGRPR